MTTKKPPPANPFAALDALRDKVPAGTPAASKPPPPAPRPPARAVVRLERKHRGGKEVTIVDKLELPPKELERWCKELKQALGSGGAVDGALIVLQGDLRTRVSELLSKRGVGRVITA